MSKVRKSSRVVKPRTVDPTESTALMKSAKAKAQSKSTQKRKVAKVQRPKGTELAEIEAPSGEVAAALLDLNRTNVSMVQNGERGTNADTDNVARNSDANPVTPVAPDQVGGTVPVTNNNESANPTSVSGSTQPVGVSAQEVQDIFKAMMPLFVEALTAAQDKSDRGSQPGERVTNVNANEQPDLTKTDDKVDGDADSISGHKSNKQDKMKGSKKRLGRKNSSSGKVAKQLSQNEDETEWGSTDETDQFTFPSSQLVTWSRMALRIAGSISIVAKAISLGLAVASKSRRLNSGAVKEGAFLLTAANDENGEIGMDVYQLLFDDLQPKLFKVASSDMELTEDIEAELGVDVLEPFDGYWLAKKGWEEVKILAEQGYFKTTTSVVTPWFMDGVVVGRTQDGDGGTKPSFMQMLLTKPAERVLRGNPEWYHRVSPDIILRNKKSEELRSQSGDKLLKLSKNPDRLEVKGMNVYILDIISVAPEYARNNPANELYRQFTSKYNCPVCPAITTLVAREWSVVGSTGLRYYEDLNRVYGTNKARLRMQRYQRISCQEMPLDDEFAILYEEDSKLSGLLELPVAEQATHRYVTLIAMAYQMRLSFQEGMHMAVDRLFVFLATHDLGIQSEAMQQLIVASTYQLFLELDDFRITLTSFGKGDRAALLNRLEFIPDLSTNAPIYGLWEHLRVKDNGSAAAMLMIASKSVEEKVNNEKKDKEENPKSRRGGKGKRGGKGDKLKGDSQQKADLVPTATADKGNGTKVDARANTVDDAAKLASYHCAYYNSETGCKAVKCPRKHAVPEKGSNAHYQTMRHIKRFGIQPNKDFLANQ